VVGRQNADIADTLYLRDVAVAIIFLAFYIWGAHWRHLSNTTEPCMCGGDAALCQITFYLTTCSQLVCISKASPKGMYGFATVDFLSLMSFLFPNQQH